MWFHLDMLLDAKVLMSLVFAVIANLIIGMVWYNKQVFGDMWQKLSGIKWSDADAKKAMSGKTLSAFLMATVMACFAQRLGFHDVKHGAELGFMLWLGFSMPSGLDGVLFTNKPMKLFVLNTSCDLLQMIVMGATIVYFLPV